MAALAAGLRGRVVLLDRFGGQDAAALMVDGRLDELRIDPGDGRLMPGAICRALPDRPARGLGGWFLRLPGGRTGFLRQAQGVVAGRSLLVQVTAPERGGKAIAVTTRLALRGRHAVITPGAPGLNLSRRIRDAEVRARLEGLLATAVTMAGAGEGSGVILRSAAAGAPVEEILAELTVLNERAGALLSEGAAPALLLDAPGAHEIARRDWRDPAPEAIEDRPGCLAAHGVHEAVDALLQRVVPLAGGGRMVIEPTEALVAVDVDAGADLAPPAAAAANRAAARELARQLRLRGLGGQVVIDFAPIPRQGRAALAQTLRAAFATDEGASLAGWSNLGLFEMTRRRDRPALAGLWPGQG